MQKGALLESLESVLVVSVITALIWLYAEAETTRTDSRPIKVRFVAPTADLAVSILDPVSEEPDGTEVDVTAVIQATRGDWPRIDDWASDNTAEVRVNVPQADSEDQVFNLRDALSDSPLVRQNAFVKGTDPATLTVRVQKLQKVEMPVSIDQGQLETSEESPPIPDPAKVVVTMPAELAAQVREQNLKLTARLDQLDIEELEEDTPISEFVALELPPLLQSQPHVSLVQDNVEVRFIVRKITDVFTKRVQVRLLISDDITGKYHIQLNGDSRFLRVTLRGPTDAIRRIKGDEQGLLVQAWVQLKLEDLTADGPRTAPIQFFLPAGVKDIAREPDITSIGYTVTPLNTVP